LEYEIPNSLQWERQEQKRHKHKEIFWQQKEKEPNAAQILLRQHFVN